MVDERLHADGADRLDRLGRIDDGLVGAVTPAQRGLARELASRTKLTIQVLDERKDVVAAGRRALSGTGLYGSRITINQLGSDKGLPYPPYLFNLVIDQGGLFGKPT